MTPFFWNNSTVQRSLIATADEMIEQASPMSARGRSVSSLRRNHTPEVGKADMPRQLNRRIWPKGDIA
jgi:hypothetical protein